MAFEGRHDQPGRRFAKGASWDDIALGAFGFVSHLLLFSFLGALTTFLWPDAAVIFLWATGGAAGLCLLVRGIQVGTTTTKESIGAILDAITGAR